VKKTLSRGSPEVLVVTLVASERLGASERCSIQLIDKVRALPPNKQQEALRLLDNLAGGASAEPNGTDMDRRPIWEVINEITAGLPADTWDSVPADGSINLDHYLYGTPNQQP
jgi:hypothetical protein